MSLFHKLMLRKLSLTPTHQVTIKRDLRIKTPDGAELLTDLYLGSAEPKAPAIIVRSPYGKGLFIAGNTAYPLASQGFNVVLQCCRGTGGSTGIFDPHHDEQRDGLTTIDWVKSQAWCNGVIATCGGSYLGYTQWAVAGTAGPEVKAMAMQVTLSDFSRMTYSGDSLMLQNALTWTYTMTVARRRFGLLGMLLKRLRGVPTIAAGQWRELPLGTLDRMVTGETVAFWQDWMTHASADDPWWSSMSHTRSISQLTRPVTMVAGWFDIFTPWQLQDFSALQAAGCDARITIGPWQHTDQEAVAVGLPDAVDWFNHHLLGKPLERRKAVRLCVMGADQWREFDCWPPQESTVESWYLQSDRALGIGVPVESPPDEYRYDPADPTPSVGGPALESTAASVDNRDLEARKDVLTYTSPPLSEARDIIGDIVAELHATSSAASADFFVRLCDVDPADVSKNVCDGLQRVRIEQPGIAQRVFVRLWPTAYRIAKGHRIRIQISSGAFPRWARNPGTLESLADATQLIAATQSIHHSPQHPSVIRIPFCAGGTPLASLGKPSEGLDARRTGIYSSAINIESFTK